MTWLIIGSVAARHHLPQWRAPKDIDLLTPAKITGSHGEICVVDSQWHYLAEELIEDSRDKVFADAWLLHTLKLSHSYWDIHWDKTLADIHTFKSLQVPFSQDLHDRLVAMWTTIHGAKSVNLNQGRDTFWQDAVPRRYDHEWLHELVKFGERPLHEGLHPQGREVWMDRDAFFDLPFDLRCKVALEEMLVVAIERGDLTVDSPKHERLMAVHAAHKKLCTTMAKGWFAQFTVQHAHELRSTMRPLWYNQLDRALQLLPKEPT